MNHDFQDALLTKLPTEPPEGLVGWYLSTHRISNAIVYRSSYWLNPLTGLKEKMVQCKCTYCGEIYYLDYIPAAGCSYSYAPAGFGFRTLRGENIISGQTVMCQECGAECQALHVGNISTYGRDIYESYPLSLGVVDGNPVCYMWRLIKSVYKDGETKVRISPHEAYVFVGKKCYKFVGWYKYFTTITHLSHWETRYHCDDTSWHWHPDALFPYEPAIWDKTCLNNCKFHKFINDSNKGELFLVSYLRTFQQHPQIENLVVAGCSALINEIIKSNSNSYCYVANVIKQGISFKEKKPSKMLGLNKTEFSLVRKNKWNRELLSIYKEIRNTEHPVKPEELKNIVQLFGSSIYSLIKGNKDISKIYRYICSQRRKYPELDAKLFHLTDYWEMAEELKMPLEIQKDFYPQNIVASHDRCVKLLNEMSEPDYYVKEAKQRAAFASLSEKYADFYFESDGFCIFIAPEPASLRAEGRALDHCVGKYVNLHAEGEKLIFFLRRADFPEISFYTVTLDVEDLRITMNLGHHNCPTTPEVQAFSDKWLEYIREVRRKQNEQGSKHNRSRECA